MTDTPVDTAVSPDLSPERDAFAHAMASVIGEWYAMSPPTRRVLGRVAPKLADDLWRAVEIGPDGWRLNRCPPVRFRRRAGMLALPVPEQGGSIEALLPFLNLSCRNDFVLVVAWLLATLRSSGPYPLLAIPASKVQQRPCCRKCSRPWWTPTLPLCGRCRATNAS